MSMALVIYNSQEYIEKYVITRCSIRQGINLLVH